MMKRMWVAAAAMVMLNALPSMVQAQSYPTRPITVVIGFTPGGPSDIMARILTKRMEQVVKQPFIIQNRPGAGGSVAAQVVARATADGYTLLFAPGSMLAINVTLMANPGYDSEKDFEPISLIGTQTNVFYANPSAPFHTFVEMIDYAKAHPGVLNFGTAGVGTPAHLAGELLKIKAGIQMTHVPYRGTGPNIQAVMAGDIPMGIDPPPSLLSFFGAKSFQPLAVTSLQRVSVLPDVPTVAELGYPGFEALTWHSIVAPAGTPKEIVAELHEAIVSSLKDPDVRKSLTDLGVDIVGSSPDELRAFIKAEIPKWAEVIKASGAKIE
jgi:tripartite-type tricarboxylate transporter receptor subunit TctC